MLLSAVSVLVVAQSSSEIPKGLMNNPVYPSVGLTVYGKHLFVQRRARLKPESYVYLVFKL